jgi:hypothetical protein
MRTLALLVAAVGARFDDPVPLALGISQVVCEAIEHAGDHSIYRMARSRHRRANSPHLDFSSSLVTRTSICNPKSSILLLLRLFCFLKLLREPAVQLAMHVFGHFRKPQAGTAGSVQPGNMRSRLKRCGRPRHTKNGSRNSALWQIAAKIDCHSTFAQVRRRRLEFLFSEDEGHRQFHRLAEVAPPFAKHEVDCSAEAAHAVESR